eukprot:3204242-Pyramimonas_sp.AAC.1
MAVRVHRASGRVPLAKPSSYGCPRPYAGSGLSDTQSSASSRADWWGDVPTTLGVQGAALQWLRALPMVA